MGRFHESLIGCFGGVVFFVVGAVNPFLFDEFEIWAEVILPEAPLVGIEVVKGFDQSGVVESVVSEEVSDTTPVFLFDVRVVIFFVGP